MNAPASPSGILNIDKQPGFTSMDVCAIIRTRLRRAGAPKRVKVGHAGTLDPLATGVLVVLVGKGTRLCEAMMGAPKRYVTTIDLSRLSTTADRAGEITPVPVAAPPTRADVDRACAAFVGVIQQKPHAFSAIRVGGLRAYDLAREGQAVELPARPVRIDAIDVIEYAWPFLTLDVRCGKGTYIRSLALDIGTALGVGGMLETLRRTAVGSYTIDTARTLEQLPDVLTQADLLPLPA